MSKTPTPFIAWLWKGVGALSQLPKAKVSAVQVRLKKEEIVVSDNRGSIEWIKNSKISFSQRLTRNMALAASLLICIAAVRVAGEEPGAQAVFQAVQEQITLDLDDSLGKLTFVSNMLPEASMVFWNGTTAVPVMAPVNGDICHVWSAAEPYISMSGATADVRCGADGEVMSVAHGENEERIVRIRHEGGVETIYGNLAACFVNVGDHVASGDLIGQTAEGGEVFFEIRQDGRSIDPTYLMKPLEASS